jgi:hypothetical protein
MNNFYYYKIVNLIIMKKEISLIIKMKQEMNQIIKIILIIIKNYQLINNKIII